MIGSSRQKLLYDSAGRLLMQGLLSLPGGRFSITGRASPTTRSAFQFGGGSDEGSIVCLCGAIDKECIRQRLDGARKAKAASHLDRAAEANPIRELVV